MFQMEAALFVPSGTMSNLISGELRIHWQSLNPFSCGQNSNKYTHVFHYAVMVHCRERGDEIIVGDLSHLHIYEQGGSAQVSGSQALCTSFLITRSEFNVYLCVDTAGWCTRYHGDHPPRWNV